MKPLAAETENSGARVGPVGVFTTSPHGKTSQIVSR